MDKPGKPHEQERQAEKAARRAAEAARSKDRRRKSQGDAAAAKAEAARSKDRRRKSQGDAARATVASRTAAVCSVEGALKAAGLDGQTLRPPCFNALDDSTSLQVILEMHSSLGVVFVPQ